MIVVTGHIRIPPEKVEHLRPHMRPILEGTRAEKGCLLYAYGADILEPGVIRIVERWQDWASLDAHEKAPHVDAWRKVLADAGGTLEKEVTAHETAGAGRSL